MGPVATAMADDLVAVATGVHQGVGQGCDQSDFDAELVWIAEVAVGKSIQETETGHPTDPRGQLGNANNGDTAIKPELRDLHANQIESMRTCQCAAELNGRRLSAAG